MKAEQKTDDIHLHKGSFWPVFSCRRCRRTLLLALPLWALVTLAGYMVVYCASVESVCMPYSCTSDRPFTSMPLELLSDYDYSFMEVAGHGYFPLKRRDIYLGVRRRKTVFIPAFWLHLKLIKYGVIEIYPRPEVMFHGIIPSSFFPDVVIDQPFPKL